MNTKIYLISGLLLLQLSCLSPSRNDEKKDAGIKKVWVLYNKSASLYDSNPDSANYYGHQCYQLALELAYPEGQSLGLTNIAYAHQILGHYPAALDTFQQAIAIDDKYGLLKRKASHYNNIGNVYKSQEDYRRAIETYDTSFKLAEKNGYDSVLCNASMNLGYVYEKLSKPDSALLFEAKALDLAQILPYKKNLNIIYNNLGKIHLLKGNQQLEIKLAEKHIKDAFEDTAIKLFYKAIAESFSSNDIRGRSESYIFLANLYQQIHKYDSSILLAKIGLADAGKASYPRGELLACEILENVYEMKLPASKSNGDSSVNYFKKKVEIEKKLFNKENLQRVEQLTMDFKKSQQDLKDERDRQDEDRRYAIGLLAIALGLVILFAVLLLIMNKKIKNRVIEVCGLATVLLLFEFINLLIHPVAEEVTHHNPFGMLLILVIPAAILARLHHRFEHWIKLKFSIKKTV